MAERAFIDPAAVHELFSERGPAGELVLRLAARGSDLARELVPRDTGRTAETIRYGTDHDPFDRAVRGWFGAGRNADPPAGKTWAAGFPILNALEARPHYVWNRSPRAGPRHSRGVRRTHPFLTDALAELEGEV